MKGAASLIKVHVGDNFLFIFNEMRKLGAGWSRFTCRFLWSYAPLSENELLLLSLVNITTNYRNTSVIITCITEKNENIGKCIWLLNIYFFKTTRAELYGIRVERVRETIVRRLSRRNPFRHSWSTKSVRVEMDSLFWQPYLCCLSDHQAMNQV